MIVVVESEGWWSRSQVAAVIVVVQGICNRENFKLIPILSPRIGFDDW